MGGPATAAYAAAFVGLGRYGAADGVSACAVCAASVAGGDEATERAEQAELYRDLFGNPFRPVSLAPAWLTPAVMKLAQAAYDNRLLPSGLLDNAGLAVLADALEEAGCTHADILSHLRGPGPHGRGCHVVDLLLGKS
jgi:hypothetical protein